VQRIVSHSNRVTAAVALRRQGADIPTIAFRLRWKPESVDHYLRECTQDIDDMSSATIAGALRDWLLHHYQAGTFFVYHARWLASPCIQLYIPKIGTFLAHYSSMPPIVAISHSHHHTNTCAQFAQSCSLFFVVIACDASGLWPLLLAPACFFIFPLLFCDFLLQVAQ
jgi:hypothetical protein